MKMHLSRYLLRVVPAALMLMLVSLPGPFVFSASSDEFVVFGGSSRDNLWAWKDVSDQWENEPGSEKLLVLMEVASDGSVVRYACFDYYTEKATKYKYYDYVVLNPEVDGTIITHVNAGGKWVLALNNGSEWHEILYGKASTGKNWANSYTGYGTYTRGAGSGDVTEIGLYKMSIVYNKKMAALVSQSASFDDAFAVLLGYLEDLGYVPEP